MRMVPDSTGRFARRPHFTMDELDTECEQIMVDFLSSRYGEVRFPVSTGDLTILVEKEADDLDQYADLSAFGPGVAGVTVFIPGEKPRVKIARELAEDARRENRLRTTLTHEYGHVRLHAALFDRAYGTRDLFADAEPQQALADRVQVCKRETIVEASSTDWMEWQAGHVCGALLMPASSVRALMSAKFAEEMSAIGPLGGQRAAQAVEEMRGAYQVSSQAAEVRLLRLGILRADCTSTRLL
jgi:hypothetical protein